MNRITPKERFLITSNAAEHKAWVTNPVSKVAIEAALAEMACTLKGENLQKLEGATHFANLLLNLAEPDEDRRQPASNALIPEPRKKN